jgi:hypothetical protein
MIEENFIRFLLDDKKQAANFVYRPPIVTDSHNPETQPATLGVKFAQGVYFLDPWGFMLIGKNRWQRTIFRIKHPVAYTKRWCWRFWLKIKILFVKEQIRKCNLVNTNKKSL